MINYYFKGLYKTTCNKAESSFSPSFLIFIKRWAYERFFLFLYKSVLKTPKLTKFYHQLLLYVKVDKIWKYWSETYRF